MKWKTLSKKKNAIYCNKRLVAQNAYCSRDIYLQFMKYLRSVILLIIIQIKVRRRVSLVKINARFVPKGITPCSLT